MFKNVGLRNKRHREGVTLKNPFHTTPFFFPIGTLEMQAKIFDLLYGLNKPFMKMFNNFEEKGIRFQSKNVFLLTCTENYNFL